MKGTSMILTSQFWDVISVAVYALVIMLAILAVIVDMLVLWLIWKLFWNWLCKKSWFEKKGHTHE